MQDEFEKRKEELIKNLISEGWLKTPRVIEAFRKIPRYLFVLERDKPYAYADYPLPTLGGQTISAPSIVGLMTELLEPKAQDKILEVGAGSGWQAAILSKLVKKVYTIELDTNLVEFAKRNLKKVNCKNVEVIVGDGSLGYAKAKPYDKIIVTCAVTQIPQALIDQLRTNGRIIAPVGGSWYQDLILGIKTERGLEEKNYGGCVFVPLRH